MLVRDKIYGDFQITDPLALELIATPAFERLKRICQFGIPDKYYWECSYPGYYRFEHCVGVYIFLNRFGASREECIAGLLHDISHTAFSHTVDWVIGGDSRKNEDYQDRTLLAVLRQPEIAAILSGHGFTPERMADHQSFGLLEREIPDICADRIDYSLRQMQPVNASRYLAAITKREGEIVFSDPDAAGSFARDFLDLQTDQWAGYEAATRINFLSTIFREAMSAGDLNFSDFGKDDDFVLKKIISTGKKRYLETLKLLESKDLSFLPKSDKPNHKKFRYVDPKIIMDGKLIRLSDIDPAFKARLEEARENNRRGVYPGRFP